MSAWRQNLGAAATLLGVLAWAACEPADEGLGGKPWWKNDADGGSSAAAAKPPGGTLEDEQFPPELLQPYAGPPIDVYDNTFVGFKQLKARVNRVFADPEIGGDTEAYFAAKVALLGGVDFKTRFAEARVVSQDFLLALDAVAKDACARAVTNKTGPFAGLDPANTPAANGQPLARALYERLLLRAASNDEVDAGIALVIDLGGEQALAWAGLCEALVRHPDALLTLPPSVATASGAEKERLGLVKLANDLVGRPPSDVEFAALAGKSIDEKVDAFMTTPEFREFFFHRVRLRTESIGTPETDEPARLWTHVVMNDAPMQEVLTASYTVDETFQKKERPAYHGKTGVLTMPGFIKSKPGLPHYNYAARVMTDFMGQLFEVTPEIVAQRNNAPPDSTVTPGTTCAACHNILTPLAMQRLRWRDDGTYREVDEQGATIDDTDRALVPSYPYKGRGMEDFAVQAVKKEKFYRTSFQTLFLFFLGRPMRYAQDERTVYLELWNTAYATNGNVKALVKVIAKLPTYLGN